MDGVCTFIAALRLCCVVVGVVTTKGTLFSQTLRVGENIALLVFSIFAHVLRYGHYSNLQVFPLDV